MFDNVGSKCKTLAKVVCWIGIIFAVIYGILLIANGNAVVGIVTAVLYALVSWLGSLSLYAIGETAETVQTLRYELDEIKNKQA